MKITVISMWHNEARLAPYFLGHYAFADKIRLIMGEDTTDDSRRIVACFPNAEIEDFTFPGKLINDRLKIDKINAVARACEVNAYDDDWIIYVDADEFIFAPGMGHPKLFLERERADVLWANMWNVYRNETEANLDPSWPAVPQRRYGDSRKLWSKPIVIRAAAHVVWTVGNHHYVKRPDIRESPNAFQGTHWRMADENIAVERHIRGRRDRLSAENRKMSWGIHTFHLTEEMIRQECRRHFHDPRLF